MSKFWIENGTTDVNVPDFDSVTDAADYINSAVYDSQVNPED